MASPLVTKGGLQSALGQAPVVTSASGAVGGGLLASAQAWIMNPMNVAAVAFVLFQFFATAKARKKAAREAATRSIQGRPTGAGQDIPICYGYTGLDALICYANVGRNLPYVPPQGKNVIGRQVADSQDDAEDEFLLAQAVLSAGAIEEITQIHVNKTNINTIGSAVQIHEAKNGNNINDFNADGTLKPPKAHYAAIFEHVSAMAAYFDQYRTASWNTGDGITPEFMGGSERDRTARFTGLGYLTSAYEQKTKVKDKRLQFGNDVPQPFVMLKGRILREVMRAGAGTTADPYTYSMSTIETFSSNWVRCVIDYLTSPIYGPGLLDADIDLETAYNAQVAADVVAQGSGSPLASRAAPHIDDDLAAKVRASLGLAADATVLNRHLIVYYNTQAGFGPGGRGWTSNPYGLSGLGADYITPTDIRRYEFNGKISTAQDFPDAIQTFEQAAVGMDLWFSREGKVKFRAPDSETDEATQVELTIDQFVEEPTISFPDANQRATQYNVRYRNWLKEASDDSETYPETGSALHNQLKERNGGLDLPDSFEAEGIHNKQAARSLAANRIFIDERPFVNFRVGMIGLLIETGDILRLRPPVNGLDLIVKVLSQPITNADWTHDVEAVIFDKDDRAWFTTDNERVDLTNIGETTLTPPASVTPTYAADERELRVVVAPPVSAKTAILSYDLEVADVSGTGIPAWRKLTNLLAGSNLEYRYTPATKEVLRVQFRARSLGISSESDWTSSNVVTYDSRLETVAGSTIYYERVPAGACPRSDLGIKGDTNIPPGGATIWRKRDALVDTADGEDGVLAHLEDVAFTVDAANNQVTATVSKLLPGSSQARPPGYLTGLKFALNASGMNELTLGALTGTAPTWNTGVTPNTPAAGDGVVGQVNQAPDGQRWARGRTDLFDEEENFATGVLGKNGRTITAGGTYQWDVRLRRFQWFPSQGATDANTSFRVNDAFCQGDAGNCHITGLQIVQSTGQIILGLDSGSAPPYERVRFATSLENGDAVFAFRKGTSGAWQTATMMSTAYVSDVDDYAWTPTDTGWSAFVASLSTTTPEIVQIVLIDKFRRVKEDPANNPWYKQTAQDVQKAFVPELDENIAIAYRATRTGARSTIRQLNITGDTTNPYSWTDLIVPGALDGVGSGGTIADIWIVDARARCRADVASPWLPSDFTAGQDGLGLEFIFQTTETDVAPTLPVGTGPLDPLNANNWPYDRPVAPWFDGVPSDFSAAKPYVWVSRRGVPGTPGPGDPKEDSWSDWDPPTQWLVWGQDGEPGVAGLPGMSRIMRMDTRVDVMPDPTPADPNDTNPDSNGEYAFLRRRPGTTGTTTQLDIASWDGLFDRPGDNENLTLRLARWDKDGADWREYLREVPKGGVITFFPAVQADGSLDTSAWIDFTIERAGAVKDFEEDAEGTFVGFHIEKIERVTKDGITWPSAFGAKSEVAFGFSWAGANATVLQEDETYYRRAATRPNPPPDTQTFGTTPSGWSTTAQMPTVNDAVWRANRSRLGGANGDWFVVEFLPTVDREYATVYRRTSQFLQPSTPISSPTWGVIPSGWTNVRPSATKTLAVWKTTRWRDRNRIEPWARPTVHFQQLPADTPDRALTVFGTWFGGWRPSPRGANYRQITFHAGADGGDGGPYEYAMGTAKPFTPTNRVSYSWPFRAGRIVSITVRARDSEGTIATYRIVTPAMTT